MNDNNRENSYQLEDFENNQTLLRSRTLNSLMNLQNCQSSGIKHYVSNALWVLYVISFPK